MIDPQLQKILVCPRDHLPIHVEGDAIYCTAGHRYPVVDGIPVMLLEEAEPTLAICDKSLSLAKDSASLDAADSIAGQNLVDAFVQKEIAATNGVMYRHLIGDLPRYPIPELRLPEAPGRYFLDLGCNWGRWCIAAARKGYIAIGIDPSLEAVVAARRVARQLGVTAFYLVADARYLPLTPNSFDVVFSYSVLQHFSRADVKMVLAQIARLLRPASICYVQMAGAFGLRNFYQQLRRGFRTPNGFEVRYWKPAELQDTFQNFIGSTTLSVDGYFSLNVQTNDIDLMPLKYRIIVRSSEVLRKLSEKIRWLTYLADSLYVKAVHEPV
jgi:SAM-dependent methyltransferase/uncharacterized protein YbaR (Trm112 family)